MNPVVPTLLSHPSTSSRVVERLAEARTAEKPAATANAEVLKAAREFEGIFLRTLLAPLEKTTQLGKSSSLSAGQSAYGSMVVSAMADALGNAGGIGLAEVIARALSAQANSPPDNPSK